MGLSKAQKAAAAKAKAEQQKIANATYAQIQSQYGLTDAILSMDTTGSLKKAFDQIRAQKITDPNRAANILAATAWFKTHGVDVTSNLALERTAPKIFQQNVDALKEGIRDQAAALGKQLSEKDLNAIARDSYVYGRAFSPSQVINNIVAKGTGTGGGTYGDTIAMLKSHAADMGINMAPSSDGQDWYSTAANKVAAGDMTVNDLKGQINTMAKSKYQTFASQIDNGFTVKQLASPYINSMANILEIGANNITLDDPTIKSALTGVGKDSQPQLKSLWQFETDLRKDPRWAQTKNARDTVDATANSILKSFGLVS